MKLLQNLFDGMKPNFEKGGKWEKFHTLYEGHRTIAFAPDLITKSKGAQIKDATDLKRVMITVVIAMIPALLFGILNIGHQHFIATGAEGTFLDKAIFGALSVLPILIVSYAVGLATEFTFCVIRNHPISEGYLVTGMLIALVMPPFIPLWQVALATIFAVVIGKEVFGGTGMNILNPALTIRAFLFFAYPTWMSGDKVWVHQAVERAGTADAISGETILGYLAQGKAGEYTYSISDMFFGFIPGSVGETSTFLILLGGLFLIYSKIASWRIMVSAVIGALVMGLIFNSVVNAGWITETSKFYDLMSFPFWQHLIVGGLAFGIVFMATDPVTGAQTELGKWYYGFFIGFISVLIRVFNPAYPEGVFLAILLMNVFAPTIDHYVVRANVARRKKRATSLPNIQTAH